MLSELLLKKNSGSSTRTQFKRADRKLFKKLSFVDPVYLFVQASFLIINSFVKFLQNVLL